MLRRPVRHLGPAVHHINFKIRIPWHLAPGTWHLAPGIRS